MSAIKGKKNRTTEQLLRMLLVRSGLNAWRLNDASIRGTPDFFFPDLRLAIFVDGCFWHCCPRCGHIPKTRSAFWKAKLVGNKARDIRTNAYLRSQGVKVIRFWEHDLAHSKNRQKVLKRILTVIQLVEARPARDFENLV